MYMSCHDFYKTEEKMEWHMEFSKHSIFPSCRLLPRERRGHVWTHLKIQSHEHDDIYPARCVHTVK
jgi:hypothetical protein